MSDCGVNPDRLQSRNPNWLQGLHVMELWAAVWQHLYLHVTYIVLECTITEYLTRPSATALQMTTGSLRNGSFVDHTTHQATDIFGMHYFALH